MQPLNILITADKNLLIICSLSSTNPPIISFPPILDALKAAHKLGSFGITFSVIMTMLGGLREVCSIVAKMYIDILKTFHWNTEIPEKNIKFSKCVACVSQRLDLTLRSECIAMTHLADLLQQPGQLLLCRDMGNVYNCLEHSKTPARPQLGHYLMRKEFFFEVSTHQHYDKILTALISIVDRNVDIEDLMQECNHDHCTQA